MDTHKMDTFLTKEAEFHEWLRNEHEAYGLGHDRDLKAGFSPSSKWPRECLRLQVFRVNLHDM
jgi:hypothetical protein